MRAVRHGLVDCETEVTGTPGCFAQIQAGLSETVKVRHIVDILDEAYRE